MPRKKYMRERYSTKVYSRNLNLLDKLINGVPYSVSDFQNPIPYDGGHFGSGGAHTKFNRGDAVEYETVKDTLLVPYKRTFNEAFREAAKNKQKQFTFNDKNYAVEYDSNPNWKVYGNRRVEEGVVPIIIERKKKRSLED